MDATRIWPAHKSNLTLLDPPLVQAFHQDHNNYQLNKNLYNIKCEREGSYLYIYDAETNSQEVKILKTPELLSHNTCITQLPDGKLFCFGSIFDSGITLIIDQACEVKELPSGTPSFYSSCIYFKNNVYCFGGENYNCTLTLSSRFDLTQNRWIQLAPMPKADRFCNSIIVNGNILISGWHNRNLFLYSIDVDSFSIIPYEFSEHKRKILINADRLYLIECNSGSIYESEPESEYNWRPIANSTISHLDQVYCLYNKGAIYIGLDYRGDYFKFDLNEKRSNKITLT